MGCKTGFLIVVRWVQFMIVLFVFFSCTDAKSQMPTDFSDLKSRGLKGPVKKVTIISYNEKQLINNKPIHPEDFIKKEVFLYNKNGGIGVSESTTGAAYYRGKTFYTKSVPLSSTKFPLVIELFTVFSLEGSPYEEKDKVKKTMERKWINPHLWVTNHYSQGKLEDGCDSTWIDTLGQIKQTKYTYLVGNPEDKMKVTQIVEERTNEKHQVYQLIIRTNDYRNPLEYKTEITDITGLQVDQYGNPIYFILRNTTSGTVITVFREIEYYTNSEAH